MSLEKMEQLFNAKVDAKLNATIDALCASATKRVSFQGTEKGAVGALEGHAPNDPSATVIDKKGLASILKRAKSGE